MRAALFFFLITIGLSFNLSVAKAQDLDQLSEKIKQNWAFPDCGTTSQSAVFTSSFYLKSATDELTLTKYSFSSGGKDYRILQRGGQSNPARIENDGILKLGFPAHNAKKADNWDNLDFEHVEEYTACAKPSTRFPKAMTRLIRYLDRIQQQCTVSMNNDCARVLFKLADENSDQVLNKAELQKALMTGFLFGELAEKETLHDKDIQAIAAMTKDKGPGITGEIIQRLDRNASGSLDYNEIVTDFKPWAQPYIKVLLQKSGKLIPVFGMASKLF